MKTPTIATFQEAVRLLLGPAWKATASKSGLDSNVEIRLSSVDTHVVLSDYEIHKAGGPEELSKLLSRKLRLAQELLVDRLDKSLGRPLRTTDTPVSGRCNYCGAPYHEKP